MAAVEKKMVTISNACC